MPLDLDRGVYIRLHSASGMQVAMYADTPGQYFDMNEKPVPVALAKSAGFDVLADQMAGMKAARLKDFQATLNKQFEDESARIARLASEGSKYAEIRAIAKDKYAIFDKESGLRLTQFALTESEATDLLAEMQVSTTADKFEMGSDSQAGDKAEGSAPNAEDLT